MNARVALLLTVVAALALAGCASGAAATIPPGATPATRIEVRLTDGLRIEPDPIVVPVGVPVTFVVTNTGVLDHELYFGDEAAQQDHEEEMAAVGGMIHDHEDGIGVRPGQTREFVYTFADAGSTLAGCHVPGHYPSGMKASVIVVP